MTLPNSDVIEYIYDGLGRRVGRIRNSSITDQFVYSDQLQIIADLDPTTGEVRTRYVYASQSHSPDFMIRDGTTYRILKDRLGSVRLVVRTSDGVIAQEIEYDEFGRRLSDTNPGFQPFGFAGGLTDLETGLVRFGARDYDPITGRWTTKDPIGFNGGDTNHYGYVANEPVNRFDPTGLYEVCSRPLSGMPFEIGPLYHQFICVNGNCGGLGPSGNILGSDGKDDTGEGTCETAADSSVCMDECLANSVDSPSRPFYNVLNQNGGINCQRWVEQEIQACRRICEEK